MTKEDTKKLQDIANQPPWLIKKALLEFLGNKPLNRTLSQNSAMHKAFDMWADQLNGAGLTVKVVLKPQAEIMWTPELIKEYLWRPVQKVQLEKESTTELTIGEVNKVYETLRHHFAEKFQIELVFPSNEA